MMMIITYSLMGSLMVGTVGLEPSTPTPTEIIEVLFTDAQLQDFWVNSLSLRGQQLLVISDADLSRCLSST